MAYPPMIMSAVILCPPPLPAQLPQPILSDHMSQHLTGPGGPSTFQQVNPSPLAVSFLASNLAYTDCTPRRGMTAMI